MAPYFTFAEHTHACVKPSCIQEHNSHYTHAKLFIPFSILNCVLEENFFHNSTFQPALVWQLAIGYNNCQILQKLLLFFMFKDCTCIKFTAHLAT